MTFSSDRNKETGGSTASQHTHTHIKMCINALTQVHAHTVISTCSVFTMCTVVKKSHLSSRLVVNNLQALFIHYSNKTGKLLWTYEIWDSEAQAALFKRSVGL